MTALPPYAFAEVDRVKLELRRAGEDVIDLGFGNPDLPSPDVAVEKLAQAARDPRNHRYSASRGIPNLRRAICDLYRRRFGVELDPEREAITTIGAKEGLSHLMWLLVEPGDVALVPDPSYPIHRFAPALAGAAVEGFRLDGDLVGAFEDAHRRANGRARTIVISFPHNPTGAVTTPELMQRIVDFAREHELLVVHDFAYADIAFDGHQPPSILQAEGARDVAVELYSLTKGFSMAGWRVGFAVGNAEVLAGLTRLKSYLDYGIFQPIQIAAIVAMDEAPDYPREVCEGYRSRRDALCRGLARAGWQVEPPKGTMFVWAEVPEPFRAEGSHAFALRLLIEAKIAVSPGAGFGPAGEGHVRFALVENEQRIAQATRGIRTALAGQLGRPPRHRAVPATPAGVGARSLVIPASDPVTRLQAELDCVRASRATAGAAHYISVWDDGDIVLLLGPPRTPSISWEGLAERALDLLVAVPDNAGVEAAWTALKQVS